MAVVTTKYGKVHGADMGDYIEYRGVPYAQPPVDRAIMGRCRRPMTEHDYELSSRMLDYWTNFMKNGDPNGDGLTPWNPCTKANPAVLELK